MNSSTLWLLIIAPPIGLGVLVALELFFIFRFSKRKDVLSKISSGERLENHTFDIKVPAILYGKKIEIALYKEFIFFIHEGHYLSIPFYDFLSIKFKKGMYVFKSPRISQMRIAVKCDNPAFSKMIADKITQTYPGLNQNKSPLSKKAIALISLSIMIFISSCFIFSGNLLMFIVISELMANGVAIAMYKKPDDRKDLGKAILIATIGALLFGIIVGLICGIELYPSAGIGDICDACGGNGKWFGNECPRCHGFGVIVD